MPDPAPPAARSRFSWSVFRGTCRRRLLAGLVLMATAAAYALYAGQHFAQRGADLTGFDRAVVLTLSDALVPRPRHLATIEPTNDREMYLMAVITDQEDVLKGLVVLLVRLIPAATIGALGIVLVAAGSVEWEVRSETAALAPQL
jgi:hypothetical protein